MDHDTTVSGPKRGVLGAFKSFLGRDRQKGQTLSDIEHRQSARDCSQMMASAIWYNQWSSSRKIALFSHDKMMDSPLFCQNPSIILSWLFCLVAKSWYHNAQVLQPVLSYFIVSKTLITLDLKSSFVTVPQFRGGLPEPTEQRRERGRPGDRDWGFLRQCSSSLNSHRQCWCQSSGENEDSEHQGGEGHQGTDTQKILEKPPCHSTPVYFQLSSWQGFGLSLIYRGLDRYTEDEVGWFIHLIHCSTSCWWCHDVDDVGRGVCGQDCARGPEPESWAQGEWQDTQN